MGEYSEFVNDGLIDNHFNHIDSNEYDEEDYYDYPISKFNYACSLEKDFNYIHFPFDELKLNDDWLLRKGKACKINEVVIVKHITPKAILFEFSEEWKNILGWNMLGKQFWLPKSILYKHIQHKKVIYIPKWTKIEIINKPNKE